MIGRWTLKHGRAYWLGPLRDCPYASPDLDTALTDLSDIHQESDCGKH